MKVLEVNSQQNNATIMKEFALKFGLSLHENGIEDIDVVNFEQGLYVSYFTDESSEQRTSQYEGRNLPVRVLIADDTEKMYEGYELIFGSQSFDDEEGKEYFRVTAMRICGYKKVFLTGSCGLEIFDVNISRKDEYIKFSDECETKAGIENQTSKILLSVIKSDVALEEIMSNLRFEGMGLSEIRLDGKLVGFINSKPEGSNIRFGYFIHPDYRNRGIATLSVKLMMKYLKEIFGVVDFEAEPENNNEAAKRVIAKAGLARKQ